MHTCIAFVWKLQVLLHTRMLLYKMYGCIYVYIYIYCLMCSLEFVKVTSSIRASSSNLPIPLPKVAAGLFDCCEIYIYIYVQTYRNITLE